MTRLPPEYERPKWPQKYASLEQWDNRFRVLSEPITGWVYFNHENKPVRVRTQDEIILGDIGVGKYGKQDPAHFRTFVVWDYQNECINILELSKKSILDKFEWVLRDSDFSDPTEYDIIIEKDGEGRDTRYEFRTGKHTPVSSDIAELKKETYIDLEKLFEYLGDPYEVSSSKKEWDEKF